MWLSCALSALCQPSTFMNLCHCLEQTRLPNVFRIESSSSLHLGSIVSVNWHLCSTTDTRELELKVMWIWDFLNYHFIFFTETLLLVLHLISTCSDMHIYVLLDTQGWLINSVESVINQSDCWHLYGWSWLAWIILFTDCAFFPGIELNFCDSVRQAAATKAQVIPGWSWSAIEGGIQKG